MSYLKYQATTTDPSFEILDGARKGTWSTSTCYLYFLRRPLVSDIILVGKKVSVNVVLLKVVLSKNTSPT